MTPAILIAVGVIGVAGLVFWKRIAPFLQPRPKPQKHEGATEKYADKLQAMKRMPAAPELVSDTEMDLQWALAWHNFEHVMQTEIEKVFAPILAAVAEFEDFDDLREQTCPKELMSA